MLYKRFYLHGKVLFLLIARVQLLNTVIIALAMFFVLGACGRQSDVQVPKPVVENIARTVKMYEQQPKIKIDIDLDYTATIRTSQGEIVVDLFTRETPITVNNFVFLARDGFYEGTIFHRIISGFMIQGGDPYGSGRGGPGYTFVDEPVTRDYVSGTLAMANSGPNTNGSQFFIMHGEMDLPKNYTIFGMVAEGQEVVDRIANASVKATMAGELSVPVSPVTIEKIDISDSAGK